MKTNLNNKTTRHCEQSEAIWTRLSRPNGLAMTNENGRSMVEILAVLAVIGVLSVGGVEGYSYAMKKNEANELAKEVSLLAHDVSQQLMSGSPHEAFTDQIKDVEIRLTKYNPNKKKYESGTPDPDDDQFALEVSGLNPEVGKMFLDSFVGVEPGLQKVQQNEEGEIQDIANTGDLTGTDDADGTITVGLVFQKDLEDTCPAGEYKVDGLCQLATGRNITSGDGVLEECPNATEPNSGHTACVDCKAGEDCNCGSQMSNGKGSCVDCLRNATCGSGNMCSDSGQCYACPTNGDCTKEQGFTCNKGYVKDGVYCCPENATCTTDKNGNMEVNCSSNYYLSNGICCPNHSTTCAMDNNGNMEIECSSDFYLSDGICCPNNAKSCSKDGIVCHELFYLKDGYCVSCIQDIRNTIPLTKNIDYAKEIDQCNATCPAGKYVQYSNTDGVVDITGKCVAITSIKTDVSGLDENYILPTKYDMKDYFSAQSWCRVHNATLLEHSKYTDEVKAILNGIAPWNIGRYWANGASKSSYYCGSRTWPAFRSTRWQCKGADAPSNSLYFACEKD